MMLIAEGLRRAGHVTFGSKRHHGLNAIRMAHSEEGKHVLVTDYVIFEPLF